ncbi:MAG: hypothetical protein Ct9H300mP8_12450 [Gammaproteobacteria bacterium]|nr:MAG: hypothetical protein Ct9H300mP8_12450 [Gammaproteobacteria bacterium]
MFGVQGKLAGYSPRPLDLPLRRRCRLDHFSASVRDNFYSSPGIRVIGRRLLELTDTKVDELDFVDLYSCFPSAVQIAAEEYGFDENRDLTVTGGLTFGGGAPE